jgi:hypothetical protein
MRLFVARLLCLALLGWACGAQAQSGSSTFCDEHVTLTAAQKNRLLLFSSAVKDTLEKSGEDVAIISRNGIDLDRFNIRYSHSGISLRGSPNTPWSVRQLYYGCEEQKPSIYDQGLSGFLIDHDNTPIPFVSIVFLPASPGRELAQTALDKQAAMALLGPQYSANAYAFSTAFQNCNQWVMELLAHAWGVPETGGDFRADAQNWLKAEHYQPSDIDVGHKWLVWATYFVPLVHSSDHPAENVRKNLYQVSMPASIEGFVRNELPQASRVEMCADQDHIVIHHGWDPIGDDCRPGAGDEVLPLS